jgi:hypothetical protein
LITKNLNQTSLYVSKLESSLTLLHEIKKSKS